MTLKYSDTGDQRNKQILSIFMATLLILSTLTISLSISFDSSNSKAFGIRPPRATSSSRIN